jgi:bacterioferritin
MQHASSRDDAPDDRNAPHSGARHGVAPEPDAQDSGTRHGRADRASVLLALRRCLRLTLACLERCKLHHYAYMQLGTGLEAATFAATCLEHTAEEQAHATRLAERIEDLGGTAEFEFDARNRRLAEASGATTDPVEMIRADLAEGRTAIGELETAIENVAEHDPASLHVLEAVCAAERRHVDALGRLLGLQLA